MLAFFILLASGTAILELIRIGVLVEKQLSQHAKNKIEKLELRLTYVIQSLNAFANSSLAINSLIDTAGRTSYLPNAIEDLARMKEIQTVIMFDFSGKPIHNNNKILPPWFNLATINPAISISKTNILFNEQRGTFLVVIPISYYDTPQGGIAAEISLTSILSENIGTSNYHYRFLIGQDWQYTNREINENAITTITTPQKFSILKPFDLRLEVSLARTKAMQPVISTLYEMLFLGIAGIIAAVLIASQVGKKLAQPILTLTQRVRNDIHPCGPIGTNDELELLATTFDEYTHNLIEAKSQLESRVHERTAQLEKKTQQLQSQHKELQNINQSLTQANTELKYTDKLKDEFISTVSHELRTPLTSIRGTLGLIAGGALHNNPEKHDELIQIALTNSERLSNLISDLLDMQKLSAGKLELQLETISVTTLLKNAIKGSDGYAQQYNVILNHIPDNNDNYYIYADHHRLRQVLDNLLSNAIKYSPANSCVDIFTESKPAKVRICIRDYGAGIPAEYKDIIFEKFTQVDATDQRSRDGTGLGLSICRDIIAAHKGEIGFTNMPEGGALFWIEMASIAGNHATNIHTQHTSEL